MGRKSSNDSAKGTGSASAATVGLEAKLWAAADALEANHAALGGTATRRLIGLPY